MQVERTQGSNGNSAQPTAPGTVSPQSGTPEPTVSANAAEIVPSSPQPAVDIDSARLKAIAEVLQLLSAPDLPSDVAEVAKALLQGNLNADAALEILPTLATMVTYERPDLEQEWTRELRQILSQLLPARTESHDLFRTLATALAGNDFTAFSKALELLDPGESDKSPVTALRVLHAIRELIWLGKPATAPDTDSLQQAAQTIVQRISLPVSMALVEELSARQPGVPPEITTGPSITTPDSAPLHTGQIQLSPEQPQAPLLPSSAPTWSTLQVPVAPNTEPAPRLPLQVLGWLEDFRPQQSLGDLQFRLADSTLLTIPLKEPLTLPLPLTGSPVILEPFVDPQNGQPRLLIDTAIQSDIPHSVLAEVYPWVVQSQLPVTANVLEAAAFLREYPEIPKDSTLLRNYAIALHTAEVSEPQGIPVTEERKDFLLRMVIAFGSRIPDLPLRTTLLSYHPSADPEPELFAELPKALQTSVAKAMADSRIVTASHLEAILMQAAKQLQATVPDAQDRLQPLIHQLQATRLDQETRPGIEREQVFYWVHEGVLQKGRIRIEDQREENARQNRDHDQGVTLQIEARLPTLGKTRAELRSEQSKVRIWISDEQGVSRSALDAEKMSLSEDLRSLGLMLEQLGWRPWKDDAAPLPSTLEPVPTQTSRRLDLKA